MRKPLELTLRITLVYAVFAALWILFSDKAVEALAVDAHQMAVLQTAKGWAFVAVTAVLLFVLLLRSHHRIEQGFQLDPLTGLLNHYMFKTGLERKLQQCPKDRHLMVCYLDIDEFKEINQRFGYDKADRFLVQLGRDLLAQHSATRLLGRFPPDQFAIADLVDPDTDLHEALNELKGIVRAAAEKQRLHATCCIGVAFYPGDATQAKDLMVAANDALRSAKAEGNAIVFHDRELARISAERRELIHDLKRALSRGDLSLVYQPKYDSVTLRPTGVEILVRWEHPKLGPVSPGTFIPLAEENGLVEQVSALVVERAADELAGTGLLGDPLEHVAINVSASEFNVPAQMDALMARILSRPELAPYVRIEITETATLKDMEQSAHIISRLRSNGLGFSIDDFGTGYTSLAMLKDFTIDEIKIDRSFVTAVTEQGRGRTIVEAIIAMARSFSINVVAEGVENHAQLKQLQELGCREAQGYLLGAPMGIEQLRSHLEERVSL